MSLDPGKIYNVDEVAIALQKFGWPDYTVFLFMLFSCAVIGIYFGFIQKKPKIEKDESKKGEEEEANYLVGGRKMKVFPVTMSLIASYVSGISLLGTPTEIYIYGIQYVYILTGVVCMGFLMSYIYLPVFHDLQLTSTYQYLQTRFDKRVRLFGSLLFVFGTMLWLPIVIYVPALAFNLVTGFNIHMITPIVCVVCIFYTLVGGLKAVVWTDVVQTIIMFCAMLLIVIKGTIDVGGISTVINRSIDSGRIEPPEWKFDLKERHTIWSLFFGGCIYWLKNNAVSQNMIQRYLSLPTLKQARCALWSFMFGVFLLLGLCSYSGLLIYATYYDCDPLTTKLARAKDQLLPLLVMDVLGDFPGLPGLFVAGVFSAALSSLSTALNSLSAVLLEDFVKPYRKTPLTERQTAIIMRAVVAIFGSICVGLVFVVEKLGSVLQLSMSLGSVSNGPLLGIFTIGVLLPWVHGTGALVGGATGLISMIWLIFRAQAAIATGELKFATKPTSTFGCRYKFFPDVALNMLAINVTEAPKVIQDESFKIHHISYIWYTTIGASITIIISLIVSFAIGANNPHEINPKLLAPCIRNLLNKLKRKDKTLDDPNKQVTEVNVIQ